MESWNFNLLVEPLALNLSASMAAWQWHRGRRKVQKAFYTKATLIPHHHSSHQT